MTRTLNTSNPKETYRFIGRFLGNEWSFTLIELLIVVAIIGILAAIAVPNFLNAQTRAKVARVYGDIKAQANALEQYRLDNNHYPPSNWGYPRLRRLTSPVPYIATLPYDIFAVSPDAPNRYMYYHYVEKESEEAWFRSDWHSYNSNRQTTANINLPIPGGLAWHIRSYGPNRQLDYGFPYDMTNGLISLGDIDVWGP